MEYEKQGNSGLYTRDYFDSLLVETRYIDSGEPDTSFAIYGKKFISPIMVSMPANLEDVHKTDVIETAREAEKAGVLCWIGTEEKEKLSEISATGVAAIKIIRPYADNKVVFSQIEQAQKCGALAVGIDLSCGLGKEEASKSMEEIREFVSAASVPFIVKGILSKKDAYKCAMAGVGGIVMSAHDSLLRYTVSPFMSLPDVLKAVDVRIPVFVDCEIRSGLDVFKALASGATAVFMKRVFAESPGANGTKDFFEKISNMNNELKSFMAQTGCHNLLHMDKTVLWQI